MSPGAVRFRPFASDGPPVTICLYWGCPRETWDRNFFQRAAAEAEADPEADLDTSPENVEKPIDFFFEIRRATSTHRLSNRDFFF